MFQLKSARKEKLARYTAAQRQTGAGRCAIDLDEVDKLLLKIKGAKSPEFGGLEERLDTR